ncbi:LOW QUALITY PROTEIN: Protein kinase domain-containing protein, related [Eimeria mitis]|uniref:non-specific serine/threonine protein kinase n=1 Tax=Eimeria mitis TaxID=44415 RepID=U6KEX6_9EIME|nr:LOW QUALITY PROTEIN: Protein kinase domain-containing protein, related [Eimeria mitis]CDJ36585.1 Protein kinase domain-containing protein, related [Eimeria mitis]
MIGGILHNEAQESIVSPSIIDKSIREDAPLQASTYLAKGNTGTARPRQWERYLLYFLTLGVASALAFTVLSKIPADARSRMPLDKEGEGGGHRGDDRMPSSATPSSAATEPEQQHQAEPANAPPADSEKDASLLSSVATVPPSRPEDQLPFYDMWGLPMLDHFEKTLPPVVKRGDEIAAFLANTGITEDADDQEPYEIQTVARTLSNGSSDTLIGMTMVLNNVKPLHWMEKNGPLSRIVRINKLLGRGTSAIVVEAEDTDTHELFAMRIFRQAEEFAQGYESDDSFVAEIRRELRLQEEGARQLCGVIPASMVASKKGISVPLYTADIAGAPEGVHVGGYFILGRVQLMERLYGAVVSLFTDAREVVIEAREYIARRLLQTVLKIQEAGLSHNDLKWDNMLLRPDGSFVIADLGSILPFGKPYRHLTLYTPEYREPQLAQPSCSEYGDGYTIPQASSDMWSLGVLLYELFTDQRYPYGEIEAEGTDTPEVMLAKWLLEGNTRSDIMLPRLGAEKVPPRWMQLIVRLLEPKRTHRITAWGILEEFPELVHIPE